MPIEIDYIVYLIEAYWLR